MWFARRVHAQLAFAFAFALACWAGSSSAQESPPQSAPAQGASTQGTPAQQAQTAAPPPPAAAQEPSMEAKERARTAYARGQAAFARGDYGAAQAAFEQAFAEVPNPIVLISVAESAAKLGHIDAAVHALDRYLQLRPDAPDRAEIEQRRASLELTPARLSIQSMPAGADVIIDGRPTGHQTPTELEISPGEHQLQLTLPGYETLTETLQAAPGEPITRSLQLQAPPLPPPAASPAPPPAQTKVPVVPTAPEGPPTAALWVAGGLGAAGLIAGTVLGLLALKERSDFDSYPTNAIANRGERLALFADVGFGVGVMALATGAVLILTHDTTPAPDKAQARGLQLSIEPTVSRSGAGASARVRF